MKLTLYVATKAANASKPDEATNILRLHLPPKSDRADDEQTDTFPDASRKSGLVELQGLSDELLAQFKAGQRVTVTIE